MPTPDLARLNNIAPVDGWALYVGDYDDGDGFHSPYFVAVRGTEQRLLRVSRFFFTPTQMRFDWIVRHGFPHGTIGARGAMGPLGNAEIDEGLIAEMVAVSRNGARDAVRRFERAVENIAAALVLVSGATTLGLLARAVL
jgi:hypothetical protein